MLIIAIILETILQLASMCSSAASSTLANINHVVGSKNHTHTDRRLVETKKKSRLQKHAYTTGASVSRSFSSMQRKMFACSVLSSVLGAASGVYLHPAPAGCCCKCCKTCFQP
uniref:Putative secreted protein n=1 Tax=Anopheles darlingi TaxID=43151 RepID=A0A2M4DH27_ANODA